VYILLRSLVRKLFAAFGLGLISAKKVQDLESARIQRDNIANKIPLLLLLNSRQLIDNEEVDLFLESPSENGQDIFALVASGKKKNGTFIEFGAYNGVDFSNTYLLERHFGWGGVLVEPIPSNYSRVKEARSCIAIHGAVTPQDQEAVLIKEVPANNLSYVSERSFNLFERAMSRMHSVTGYSLSSLMMKFLHSTHVDFLSVDVEGLELDILSTVDFDRYSFGAICVEHNNSENKIGIRRLLESKNYYLVMEELSGNDFWYVHHSQKDRFRSAT